MVVKLNILAHVGSIAASVSYGKFPSKTYELGRLAVDAPDLPTLEEASVREFRVVLLPDEGFPTSPIRGSRPIVTLVRYTARWICDSFGYRFFTFWWGDIGGACL